MKTILLLFILFSITMPVTSFAQSSVNCNFGDSSTSLDKIFEKDIAAKTFTEKYPNAARYVAMEDSYPINGELSFTVENNNKKEVLLIKFNQNENGCYRPYAYHYSFNDGIIDVTVKNSIMNFGEIINLIKLDDKKIEDFYTKNCNQIQLDFVSNGESKPYFCKYDIGNSIEMILQKHVGGAVEIHIPDKAIDALFYDCEIIDFIVLDNGEEINYELDDIDKKIFKMELPSGYNKIEIVGFSNLSGTDRFCGSIWSEDSRYISPLLQTKIGIELSRVQCNDDLILIQKYDGSPVCVKSLTAEKLIERGSHMNLHALTIPQYSVSTGTYSGFCVGYCSTSFTITPDNIIILKTGSTREGPLLDQATQAQLSEKNWNKIVDSIDFQKFVALPDKIGCPGCADAPVNWIEISDGNQTKKIEYESQEDIPEIKQLRTILEEITTALNSKLEQSDNKIITLDEKDKLVEIKKGEKFLVQLDSNYSWRMDIDNKTVIDSDYSDIRYSGSQAVYLAHSSGNATITGVGDPHCQNLEPPCMSPSILFQIDVKVE